MTTIDKLGILGIRSYGTDEETLIKFYKPLTILLGRNGTGKSTIIEAVKMATTGDLPPFGDKGAAFIHDPRIDNETETKAKIRLMFTNVRGDQYVVSRHFQLSLKRLPRSTSAYKTEYKSLDHTLKKLDNRTGGRAKAFRANDLNAILPDIMRVSKPVLNNVIFVHQEESLWPLSDSRKLKEKFDEIFAATRYTKALEVIRKYRKDQNGELKTVNVELMHYEDKVKRLEEVRNEVDKIQVRHNELKRGVSQLDNEIATLQQEADSAEILANEYAQLNEELGKVRMEASFREKEKGEKYNALHAHLADTDDDDIRKQIDQLQTSLNNFEEQCQTRARLIEELNADIELKNAEYTKRQTRQGMLEQQAKNQRDRLENLERMKNEVLSSKDLGEQLYLGGKRVEIPDMSGSIERWSQAYQDLQTDADAYIDKITEDGNNTLDAVSKHWRGIEARLEKVKTGLETKKDSVDEARLRLREIRSELTELEQAQVSIKDAESRRKALETALHDKQKNGQITLLEEKISVQRKRISSAREDLKAARRTRDLLLQDQEEQTKREVARQGVKTNQIRLNSAMEELVELQIIAVRDLAEVDMSSSTLEALRSQISSVGSITDDNATDKYPVLQEISSRIVAKRDLFVKETEREHTDGTLTLKNAESRKVEAERISADLGSEVQQTKLEVHRIIKELQELQDPPEHLKTLLSSATHVIVSPVDSQSFGGEWFFDTKQSLDDLQSAISKAKHKVSQQETGLALTIGDLEQFEEHPKHMCPACGMVSSKKVDIMRSNLENRVEIYRDPEGLTAAKLRLKALEDTFGGLKRLDALTATASALSSKLTNASVEKNDAVQSFKAAKTTQSRTEKALSKAKHLNTDGNTQQVSVKIFELKQLMQNFQRAQQELDTLQTSLSVPREDERSLTDAGNQVAKLENELAGMETALERTQESLESEREDLRRVEVRFHEAVRACLEQKTKSERHKGLISEKENLNASMRKLEEQIDVDTTTCSTLEAELREVEEDFQRTRGENDTLVRHAKAKMSKRQKASQAWLDCKRGIEAYERGGKDRELRTLIQSLDAITSEISSKKVDLAKHTHEDRKASDSRNVLEAELQNLRDNQKYRLLEQELKAITRSMRHFDDRLGALKQQAGELPAAKVKRLMDQVNTKNSDRRATLTEQKIFAERYKEKRKELLHVESEGSRRKFDECRIKKQTMQLASGDLERYHRALDQALMAFHTLKMNSINRTIKELWQQTYRGTDIEEIEITSDHGDGSTGAIKRNFNYRVQMRRGGAVLDMRGRCSAGQKVLACLVIRLALAESFCTDCGILALDEPTTNLDRENIDSLAEALKTIIEVRRKHRNFQLILITHDQDFIEKLGARDICNEYYTVYKDGSGVSRAKLQDLQTIL